MSADTSGASDSFLSGSDVQKERILNKKFRIVGIIQSGGIGTYKAIELQSGKTVVIKMLSGCLDKKVFGEVHLKTRPCFKLSHPNILQTYDLESDGEQQYFVTEYVDGIDLEQRIFSKGILSAADVVETFSQIAEALDFAHRQHVYHGDIKLSNIIITRDGKARLAGFGIAIAVEATKVSASGQKSVDPPFYRAPEQIRGSETGCFSDIYSLAAVIYECLCGHPPFWGSSIEQQILNDNPATLEILSEKQNAAILKALSKKPSDRQNTAKEFIKQLADGQIKQPVKTRVKQKSKTSVTKSPESPAGLVETVPIEKDKQKNTRKKAILFSAVSVFIFLTIIVGLLGWSSHKRHQRELEATRLWQQAQLAATRLSFDDAIGIADRIIEQFPDFKFQHYRDITEQKRVWENSRAGQQSWFTAKNLAEQKKYKEAIAAGKTFLERYYTSQYINEAQSQILLWEHILLDATNTKLLSEARVSKNIGDLDKAEENVTNVLRTDPKNTEAQSLKQEIYSLQEAKRIAAERQAKFQILTHNGIYLQNEGKWQEAIENYKKALEINADAGDLKDSIDICQHGLYSKQGDDAEHKGDLTGAINSYEKALTYKLVEATRNKLESAKERLRIEQKQAREHAARQLVPLIKVGDNYKSIHGFFISHLSSEVDTQLNKVSSLKGDVVFTKRPISEADINNIHNHNLRVFVGFNKKDITSGYYLCYIFALAKNPAVLGWYLGDVNGWGEEANQVVAQDVSRYEVINRAKSERAIQQAAQNIRSLYQMRNLDQNSLMIVASWNYLPSTQTLTSCNDVDVHALLWNGENKLFDEWQKLSCQKPLLVFVDKPESGIVRNINASISRCAGVIFHELPGDQTTMNLISNDWNNIAGVNQTTSKNAAKTKDHKEESRNKEYESAGDKTSNINISKPDNTQASGNIIVTVNGDSITEAEVDAKINTYMKRMTAQIPPNMVEQYKKQIRGQAIENMILEKLLDEQIKKTGINITESDVSSKLNEIISAQPGGMTIETFKAMLVAQGQSFDQIKEQIKKTLGYEKLIGTVVVNDAQAKAYYEENKADFDKPEQVKASHILMKVAPTATVEEKAAAKAKIERLLKQVRAGGDFAVLAKENSDCPSKERGGDLGFFDRGTMVKEFSDAAFAMKVGEVSNVVETQFGYHIIKVTDHKQGGVVAFDSAKADIVKSLSDKKKSELFKQFIEKLKAEAKIVYYSDK